MNRALIFGILVLIGLILGPVFAADFSMISGVESVKVTQDKLVEITVSKPLSVNIVKTLKIGDMELVLESCALSGKCSASKTAIPGETFIIRPKTGDCLKYGESADKTYGCSVWEDLYIGGKLVSGATWWNVSFSKCMALNLTTGASAGAPWSALNVSIPYDSNMNTTFKDIRVINGTCSGGGSLVTVWQALNVSGVISNFFVNTSGLPASTTTQWSVYYGNPTAESVSDLNALYYPYKSGVANGTVAQQYGLNTAVWASDYHSAPYIPWNAVDGLAVTSYLNSWVCSDANPHNWTIRLPWNFTVVKTGMQQGNNYHILSYRTRTSFDNATWSTGWLTTGGPDTNFLFWNSTVDGTFLPQTGRDFMMQAVTVSASGTGMGEYFLYGFNATDGISYALGAEQSHVPPDTFPPINVYQLPDQHAQSCYGDVNFTTYLEDEQSSLKNLTLWTNETSWGIVAENQTALANATNSTIGYSFAYYGCYLWALFACDSADNCDFGSGNEDIWPNRTLCVVECQEEPTTTTICGNGTCCEEYPVTLKGFNWFVLFWIILVVTVVLVLIFGQRGGRG